MHHVICQGVERFQIEEFIEGYSFIAARIKRIQETMQFTTQTEALALQLRESL